MQGLALAEPVEANANHKTVNIGKIVQCRNELPIRNHGHGIAADAGEEEVRCAGER